MTFQLPLVLPSPSRSAVNCEKFNFNFNRSLLIPANRSKGLLIPFSLGMMRVKSHYSYQDERNVRHELNEHFPRELRGDPLRTTWRALSPKIQKLPGLTTLATALDMTWIKLKNFAALPTDTLLFHRWMEHSTFSVCFLRAAAVVHEIVFHHSIVWRKKREREWECYMKNCFVQFKVVESCLVIRPNIQLHTRASGFIDKQHPLVLHRKVQPGTQYWESLE